MIFLHLRETKRIGRTTGHLPNNKYIIKNPYSGNVERNHNKTTLESNNTNDDRRLKNNV